jgi:hypothetical protein
MNGVWTSTEDMTIVLETLAGFSLEQEISLLELVVEYIPSADVERI